MFTKKQEEHEVNKHPVYVLPWAFVAKPLQEHKPRLYILKCSLFIFYYLLLIH
jgi:hypothetical protein